MYFCIPVFVSLAHVSRNLKSLNHEINDKEKIGHTKYSREKQFWPRKYPREKIFDPRIPTITFRTHEILTRKIFWTHEIPTRENFGTTKYPRRHGGTMELNPRDSLLLIPTKFSTLEFTSSFYKKVLDQGGEASTTNFRPPWKNNGESSYQLR